MVSISNKIMEIPMETNERLEPFGLPAICSAIAVQNAMAFLHGKRMSLRQIAKKLGYSQKHKTSFGTTVAGTRREALDEYMGMIPIPGKSAARYHMVRQPCIVSYFKFSDAFNELDTRGHVFFSAPRDEDGSHIIVMNLDGNNVWETDSLFEFLCLQGELPGEESDLAYIRVYPL